MQHIWKLIAWFSFTLGAILILGGIYTATEYATSSIRLLDQEISTTSIGLALAFLGVVMVIFTFGRLLITSKKNGKDTDYKISVIVHESDDKTRGIENAEVTLLTHPEPKRKLTGLSGHSIFFYNSNREGDEIVISARKEGYVAKKSINVTLQNDSQYFISLELEDKKNGKLKGENINRNTIASNYCLSDKTIMLALVGVGQSTVPQLAAIKKISNMKFCHFSDRNSSIRDELDKCGLEESGFNIDYLELLKNKEIDAVVIATELKNHFEHAMNVLKSGKNLLLEKPATQTLDHKIHFIYSMSLAGKMI